MINLQVSTSQGLHARGQNTIINHQLLLLGGGFSVCMTACAHLCLLSTPWDPARLLCPWALPCKNTGVHCHSLLQGILLTQRSNPCLPHWQVVILSFHHQGNPSESAKQLKDSLCVSLQGVKRTLPQGFTTVSLDCFSLVLNLLHSLITSCYICSLEFTEGHGG